MTDLVSFVPPAASTGASSGASAATLAGNFDTFLTILTAQIQNQDPLEPLDSSQFTEQLVQFSGVEQQIRSNAQLEQLLTATRSNAGAALSGYLGQEAEIDSSGAQFNGEPVRWRYTLPADADRATVTVTDEKGKVLYSTAAEKTAGSHDFVWDGRLFNDETATKGEVYYINVVASDANDVELTPVHSLVARVTGVDLSFGEPALTTGYGVFAFSDIRRLVQPQQQNTIP
jgi:flagellar basal-body rod modification protein FlgD